MQGKFNKRRQSEVKKPPTTMPTTTEDALKLENENASHRDSRVPLNGFIVIFSAFTRIASFPLTICVSVCAEFEALSDIYILNCF